jgi:acyl dehydratase
LSIEELEGANYGPYEYRTDPEKVAEYGVLAGTDPSSSDAPLSLAGALLFVVAPHLLADPRAGDATRSVIHGDQGFKWHRPIPLGAALSVTGSVTRVRERGGVYFTGFALSVTESGSPVLDGTSTFLMSSGATTTGSAEHIEPMPGEGSRCEVTGSLGEDPTEVGVFAASRADLIRYAGASRDWNPIHWDHDAAVAAGLAGIVVHGLLQSAWVVEAAVRLGVEPTFARFRYRRPLGAGVATRLVGSRGSSTVSFELADDDGPYLTATLE